MNSDRLRNHFTRLAQESGVRVCTGCRTKFVGNSAHCNPSCPSVCIAPITGEISYAAAMHELGHIRAPQGSLHVHESRYKQLMGERTTRDSELLCIAEYSAWEWAHRHAIFWTPVMTRVYRFGIGSYEWGLAQDHTTADEMDEKLQQYATPVEAIKHMRGELLKVALKNSTKLTSMLDGLGISLEDLFGTLGKAA